METKVLNLQDEQVITDAVKMLKSDFVAVYTEMGYDKMKVSLAWHSCRTSKKGQEIRQNLPSGNNAQAASFVSEPKEEAQERLKKQSKKKVIAQEGVVEDVVEEKPEIKKEKKVLKEGQGKKGEKGKLIRELIAQGIIDVGELVEKSGASKLYVGWVLKNSK